MKKTFLYLLLFAFHINANAQMVVSDPGSVAQRALNFVDQMAEAIEEKYAMYEQIEATIKQAELVKEGIDKYKKVMDWVKQGKEIIAIIQSIEDFAEEVDDFREYLSISEYLTTEEQYQHYYQCYKILDKETEPLLGEAKKYINDFKNEEDAGLTSAERIQLLRNIQEDIKSLRREANFIMMAVKDKVDKRKNSYESQKNLFYTFKLAVK